VIELLVISLELSVSLIYKVKDDLASSFLQQFESQLVLIFDTDPRVQIILQLARIGIHPLNKIETTLTQFLL
jgi:hypothetical protein